jgi:hypothetical protein
MYVNLNGKVAPVRLGISLMMFKVLKYENIAVDL